MSPCPCPRPWRGVQETRPEVVLAEGEAPWALATRVTSSHFLPYLPLQLPGQSLPVTEARQAGLEEPRWATPKVALGREAEPCRGGGREQGLAAEPRARPESVPLYTHTQSPSHTHTKSTVCTHPGEACPFSFLLPSLNLNRQAGPGALVLPSAGSPWAREQQRDPRAGLWT